MGMGAAMMAGGTACRWHGDIRERTVLGAAPKARSYAATPARRRRVSQPTNDRPPIINA